MGVCMNKVGLVEKGGLRGYVEWKVIGKDGKVKASSEGHNVITDVGRAQDAGLLGGLNSSVFDYIAIGTGTTAEAVTDTALVTEVARKQGTASQITTSVSNDTLQVQATFSSDDGLSGTATIGESGLFDASTGGNMLARKTLSASVDWDSGDTLQITWKIQIQ